MIFQSKQTVNGKPVWAVDTETLTVIHITKTGETEQHSFWHDCVKYHLHYCEEHYPERLQKLVDSGEIYVDVEIHVICCCLCEFLPNFQLVAFLEIICQDGICNFDFCITLCTACAVIPILHICLSANEVPRVAQMFGLDTSAHVNMTSVSSVVGMGSRAAKLIIAKH